MKDSLFLDICLNDYRAIFQMVRRSINLCPEELWNERTDEPPFWQQTYHAIFYTDFYLSNSPAESCQPSFVEAEAADLNHVCSDVPSQQQMKKYLQQVSKNCKITLGALTGEQLEGKNNFPWTGPTLAHRLIYNIRHTQHHVGWLNSILSRKTGKAAEWVIAPRK